MFYFRQLVLQLVCCCTSVICFGKLLPPPATPPIVITKSVANVTASSALLSGSITSNGSSTVTAKGFVWSTSPNPRLGNAFFTTEASSSSPFSHTATGLTDSTIYYVCVYATNSLGTGYGSDVVFTTSALLAPALMPATTLSFNSGTANWNSIAGAAGYRIDVSPDKRFDTAIIASEDFENSLTLFTTSTGPLNFYSGNSASGDMPPGTPFAATGIYALGKTNGSVTITSAGINTIGYSTPWLHFRLAALGIGSIGEGPDETDIVSVSISPDNGVSFYNTLQVTGKSNANWSYSSGLGIATTAYDGNSTPVTNTPFSGGSRSADGYSNLYVTGLPAVSNLVVRITFNCGTSERWLIDNFTIEGFRESYVSGFKDLTVNTNGIAVTGLSAATNYYYRVRTIGSSYTTASSSTQSFSTINDPSTADYRSRATGNFSSKATWEYNSTGTTWADAIQPPGSNNNITLQNLHTITQDIDHTIAAGKTFTMNAGSSYIVGAGKSFTVAGTASFNGQPVTFKTNGTNTPGRLGQVTGTLTNATNVTVERFIPLGKVAYRQLAPGVTTATPILNHWQEGKPATPTPGAGMHITGSTTGANGFDQTIVGGISMYTYAAGTPVFTSIGNTDVKTLNALQGYRVFVNGDRNADLTVSTTTAGPGTPNISMNHETTIRATGTVITGPVTYNSTGATAGALSNSSSALTTIKEEFSMIPNPYWSPVDFDLLTKTGVASTYWLWDPSMANRGAYVSYNSTTGSSGGNITKDIQPGQSIFVQTTGGSPSIVFNEDDKSTGFTNTIRTAGETPGKMRVKLYTSIALHTGGNMQDATMVAFRDDFNDAISNEDAAKFTNTDENIAIVKGNTALGVEGRPTVAADDTIAIRLWKLYGNNSYTLRLDGTDFDAGITGILVDKKLNQQYTLNMSGSIDVPFAFSSSDSSSFYDRFILVFRSATVLPVSFTTVKAFKKNNAIQVEWNTATETNVKQYEVERSIDGRLFNKAGAVTAKASATGSAYEWLDLTPASGNNYYRIRSVANNGATTVSGIASVNLNDLYVSSSIFPNPVKGKKFHWRLAGLERGNYTIRLFNQLGQTLFTKPFISQGGSLTNTIEINESLAPGVYILYVQNSFGIQRHEQVSVQR
jgi:hypothetical protein